MLDSLWTRLLTVLERKLPATTIENWVRPCRISALNGDHLRIAAPSKFTRDWLAQHHTDVIQGVVREVLGGNPRVTIEVDREAPAPDLAEPQPASDPASAPATGLSARYTFESFVVGNSNQFAQAACQAVADLPSRAYNPLFIYGGVGLGKTHLLHAVGHQVAKAYPHLHVLYLSSERFTNELINAIRYDRTAEFRAKYRNIDLLLIDDVQFISGKERTQEEFFHTFNDLYEARKQIVLSSDAAPKEIPELEERLRSRFEWGLIADIQPPDLEMKVAIIRKKAAAEKVEVPNDVAMFIAGTVKSNIRELEGRLNRVLAFSSLTGKPLSVELARETLRDIVGTEEHKAAPSEILKTVASHYGLRVSDMKAKSNAKPVAFPRQVAMYLCRKLTELSYPEIGRLFNDKHHSTVMHSVEKIERMIEDDADFRRVIDGFLQAYR